MNKSSLLIAASVFLVLGAPLSLPAAEAPQPHTTLEADELAWQAVPVLPAGATGALLHGDPTAAGSLFALRVRYSDGYRLPPHWHPQDEHITVLKGTILLGVGTQIQPASAKKLREGAYAHMPAKAPHYLIAEGETILQLWGIGPLDVVYVDPADDPRAARPGTP